LCILIPFRDRWKEINETIPELNAFLLKQELYRFHFILLNQVDKYRFNRASLINVGWFESKYLGCDYIAMHDADLIPLNNNISYGFPEVGRVLHIASGKYHPVKRYDYKNFIGGILILTMEDFKKVNGMSNKYWGWGLEDDEFFLRLRDAGLSPIIRPQNLTTNRLNTFKHIHSANRKRDIKRTQNQKEMSRKRDRTGGLSTVSYKVVRKKLIMISSVDVLIVNVELHCNLTYTPYCISLFT